MEGPEDRAAAGESERPGDVVIYALNKDGSLPDAELKNAIKGYLLSPKVHYVTDRVYVEDPTVTSYDVELTYYIDSSDNTQVVAIQEAVEAAVTEYVKWQRLKLGRDINPSRLIRDIIVAGAKRVEIISPTFTVIGPHGVAIADNVIVTYGGLEDG